MCLGAVEANEGMGALELQVIESSPVWVLGTELGLPQGQCHSYHQIISEATLCWKR